ncbi:hypothetical protein [Deinococcus arcticus]|uniref:Uncharacterized protein n=1 Tax=Deinococcus arcticus TaxID=2136176 RepID=A0A2T3W361_9DEIO|nr:hypothetical protein [Deinococcus arcticus]PTA66336.1 hypothetical protein C8263_18510 [Deinococcus arcticus]
MKKLPFFLLCLTGVASAAPANCDTTLIYGMVNLNYQEQAVFPNEPKQRSIALASLTKPLAICGFTITNNAKAGILTIKAPSIEALGQILSRNVIGSNINQSVILATVDGTQRPIGLFNLELSRLIGNNAAAHSTTYDHGNLAVAVTANGGKLFPLLYNGTTQLAWLPDQLTTLDFYAASTHTLVWQRLNLNFTTKTLTVYKKARIPGN